MPDSSATCCCGHPPSHHVVDVERTFSSWGWFALLILGITARPKKATWRCRHCGQAIKETRNPRELEALR